VFLAKQSKLVTTVRSAVQSFGLNTGPQSFYHSLIALSITRCSKSPNVRVCQVATVVMETAQLILSQLKNIYCSQLRIEYGLSLPK